MPSDLEIGKNFFHFFSMFEYALKANSYWQTNRQNIITGANWEKFATENHTLLDVSDKQNEAVKESVEYLLEQPPKKQAVGEERQMVWVDPPAYEDTEDHVKLTRYIRQVRNNLFHGGKFRGNYFETPERSKDLICHSAKIMMHLARNHEGMREAFEMAHFQFHL